MNEFPGIAYKYLRPEHAASMATRGEVRVGTLFEYRSQEGTDPERGDAGEGHLELHSDPGRHVYNSTAELPAALRGMSIECGSGGIVTEGENAVVIKSGGSDMLVYCMSLARIEPGENEFGGACVEIRNVRGFLDALDAALRAGMAAKGRALPQRKAGPCCYSGRRHNWHTEIPPAWLLKPARFEHQNEYRCGWVVDDGRPLKPMVVSASVLAGFCRIVYGLEA